MAGAKAQPCREPPTKKKISVGGGGGVCWKKSRGRKNAALRRTPHFTESRESCSDSQEMRKLAYHGPLTLKALLVVNSLHLNALKPFFLCMRFFRGLKPLNERAYKTIFNHLAISMVFKRSFFLTGVARNPRINYLFSQKLQQLLLGFLHIILWSTNQNFVAVSAFGWKLDTDATTLIHDGTDEPSLGTN